MEAWQWGFCFLARGNTLYVIATTQRYRVYCSSKFTSSPTTLSDTMLQFRAKILPKRYCTSKLLMHNTYHVELQSPFYQQTQGLCQILRFIEVVDTMERIHKHNHSSYHNSSCMEFHKKTRSTCLLAKQALGSSAYFYLVWNWISCRWMSGTFS